MIVVGYADRLSVEPGGEIAFMVSAETARYDAGVVRLIHGDTNPAGPGFKAEAVESDLAGSYPGRAQSLRPGSYARIPFAEPLDGFTILMWIRPTLPEKSTQTLISRIADDGAGFAVRLEGGRVGLQVGPDHVVRLERALEPHVWYAVTAAYDAGSGEARVSLASTDGETVDTARRIVSPRRAGGRADVLIAAELIVEQGSRVAGNFYNGKIGAPRLYGADGLVAAWNLSAGIASSIIVDVSGNAHDGHTVNKPTRAVTGWNWDGSETAWRHAPDQYDAIHFHDDDLDDASWERSLGWTVPDGTPSGVYAVHLQSDGAEDFIPFAVRPARGRPTARIAFLMPTFSYLAYANEHELEGGSEMHEKLGATGAAAAAYPSTPQDRYVVANRLNSLYDTHTDGSGVCYSSRLRPLVNMRPKYVMPMLADGDGSPHQFNADLHLVDWLHEHRYAFDVLTDEDLHLEGAALLEPYRVVLTGTHHEYWSIEMIEAMQLYLRTGGRLINLAGNGMYWVTQHDPETRAGIEVRRRGPATRTWEPQPGEAHLSATGELGGLWRYRGYAPQSWLGVGFTAQGIGKGRPYDRRPESFDPRAAWIFEGVGSDERIGDFPCLVDGYGAAGLEIDRADYELGTPRRALVVATATGFSDSFQHACEEVLESDSAQGGSTSPWVRADMVLLEYPKGGAVFSPGSITWCGCLSYNGYDNNVSRITQNVLDRFASERAPSAAGTSAT